MTPKELAKRIKRGEKWSIAPEGSNSALNDGLDAETLGLRKVFEAAKALMPEWQNFCDHEGKLERSGYYLWNTKKMYALFDAVKDHEGI